MLMAINPMLIASGISAGSKLLGGILGKGESQKKQVMSQISGKMAAAKKYGISPLAMLGAQTQSFPSQGIGDTLADMGQDISRSVASRSTDSERSAIQLGLEKAKLENDYLRAQIASVQMNIRSQMAGPPKPVTLSPEGLPETVSPPARTSHVNAGVSFETNPWFSDAQTYEDRFGELGGSALGLINIPADYLWHNYFSPNSVGKRYVRHSPHFKRPSRNIGYPRFGGVRY